MVQYEGVQANLTAECERMNFTGSVTEIPLFVSSAAPVLVNCSVTPTPPVGRTEICWETMLGQVRKRSLFMATRGRRNQRGGKNLSASTLRGGAEFECMQFEGGGAKFECNTIQKHPLVALNNEHFLRNQHKISCEFFVFRVLDYYCRCIGTVVGTWVGN